MTRAIVDQAPLRASDRRSSWDAIMSYVDQLRRDHGHVVMGVDEDVLSLVLADMRGREAIGGPGRDQLADAYQGCLATCAHLMEELGTHGVDLSTHFTEESFPDQSRRWHLHDVQQLCASQIRTSIHLRAIIEERRQAIAGKVRAS